MHVRGLGRLLVQQTCSTAGAGRVRLGSTSKTDGQEATLKTALRALYKKVHPDLLHSFPDQKAENEKSFKLLQQYLQQAREGDPHALTARLPYNFIFHLRSSDPTPFSDHTQPSDTPNSPPADPPAPDQQYAGEPDPELHRVAVTLPPPTRAPGPASKQLSATVVQALTRLLTACGVDVPLDPYAPADGGLPSRLLDFLPDAMEEARQKAVSGASATVRLANIRGAMRLSRQVLVVMGEAQADPVKQLQQLERLAGVLQSEPWVNLKGCTIGLLAQRTSLDPMGVLWLATNDTDQEWAEFLAQVDVDYARQLRSNVAAMRKLEAAVAAAVGVATICTVPSASMTPAYRYYLERLAAEAAEKGPVAGGQLAQVPLVVAPPATGNSGTDTNSSPGTGCSVDPALGSVKISVDTSASDARQWLQDNASEVLAARQQHLQAESEAEDLIRRTRSTIRLRRLLWNRDAVSLQQLRSCCREMMALRQPLMELLEGASVRVSDRFGVASDGSYVDVPWDFEM